MTNNNDQVPNRKRKNNQFTTGFEEPQEDDCALSLSSSNRTAPANQPFPSQPQLMSLLPMLPPPQPPQLISEQTLISQNQTLVPFQLSHSHTFYGRPYVTESSTAAQNFRQGVGPLRRFRRNPTQVPREGKSATVPPPFRWATNDRATVHSLEYLLSEKIYTITGDVHCRRCERQYEMGFDLQKKFDEVGYFMATNRSTMHDRAPDDWMNPVLPKCKFCDNENWVRPIISEKKREINWLFLLLGQMLGCCTLEQLKYFCKHTQNHRTGAKNRILYLTYLGLCKQLDPTGPFNV